jgi:hypothetical protein
VAHGPGSAALKHAIYKLVGEGYCRACIKQRLRLTSGSADEVEVIACNTPGGLDGVCLGCNASRDAAA